MVLSLSLSLLGQEAPRRRESFDAGWRFVRSDVPGAEQPACNDAAWRRLNLPHDWSIEGPYDEQAPTGGAGGYLPTGVGWYRKHFAVPADLRGKMFTVQFDGVYQHSDVWLNGHHLGFRPYGYSSFTYDLTPYLNYGAEPNVIAVRVDNSAQPNSRWYSGSGIDRHVWITVTDPLHVAPWGTYVTTPQVSAEVATVRIRVRVRNERAAPQTFELRNEILAPAAGGGSAGGPGAAAVAPQAGVNADLPAGAEGEFENTLTVPAPSLWSPATPSLYRLRTEVREGGRVVDAVETPFGIRSLVYDVDRGFLLNGEPVKLQGMCLHEDGGAVGAAVPEGVWVRRLQELKAMGCNAIRTAHNPPAPEFLDLCDRLGFLVMDEAFDEWTVRKPQIQHGYSEYFDAWYERDLIDMIHRDRNHPCIVLWSAGNEIGEQRMPGGEKILAKLVAVFHREDPTRPVTAAMDNVHTDQGDAPAAFTDLLDIVGYNYVDRWGARRETYYADDRRAYPQRRFVGTEDDCIYGVRGRYDLPATPAAGEAPRPPRYATAMIRTEQLWKFDRVHDYVIGDFFWTGIDYLGESRWPGKASSSGVIDTAGFPKDGYYFFQSQWTEKSVLHLFPSWNWAGHEGQVIPVLAYTNCDTVELFLNGRSLGVKAGEFPRQGTAGDWNRYPRPVVPATTADLHLSWDVPYEPGVLRAVGYQEGRPVAEAEVRTAGAPAALVLSADRDTIDAGGGDVASVTARIVDANGVVVPGADNLITFAATGPGAIIGVDNGDPASHESYQTPERHAFNGLALALVRPTSAPGEIHLMAASAGLTSATLVLHAAAAPDAVPPMIAALDP
jgi:beta-galactosidase